MAVTVRLCDVRQARVCWSGARKFLEANGFDSRDFLKNGISVKELAVIDHEICNRVVEAARGRTE